MFIYDRIESILSYHFCTKNRKTALLEDNVNFFDSTKKQSSYFKIFTALFVVTISVFFLLFKYLNE